MRSPKRQPKHPQLAEAWIVANHKPCPYWKVEAGNGSWFVIRCRTKGIARVHCNAEYGSRGIRTITKATADEVAQYKYWKGYRSTEDLEEEFE